MNIHNVRLLRCFNLCLDFRPYAPIAILYFAQVSGSFTLALAVFSIVNISACIFEVPTGVISDLIGRKKTMIWGQAASVVTLALYAIGGSFGVLVIGAVCEGLSRSLFSGNNNALLYDTLNQEGKKERFGEVLGKVDSMFQIGLATSALIGGFIADISFSFVMWASVIPQIAGLFITFFVREPAKHTEEVSANVFAHMKEALVNFKRNAKLRMISFAKIFDYGLGETLHELRPAFVALLWPTWAIGLARTLAHTFGAMSFYFSGKVLSRFPALKTLIVTNTASNLVTLAAVAYPTVASPALLASASASFGIVRTGQNVLAHQEFTDAQRATMDSLNSFIGSLFFAAVAVLFGALTDKVGPTHALLVGQVLSFGVLIFYWRLSQLSKAQLKTRV